MLQNPRSGCLNSGFQLTRTDADSIGQQCLYTVLSFISKAGGQHHVEARTYDTDLTPPDVPLTAQQVSPHILQMGV